jgi:DNA-binding NarL/FixJ family response regulator
MPLAERAYEELRAAGVRPRTVLRTGFDSLTPSEMRVAQLAASGKTNREIAQELYVTPKTVEFHLGQTYRKLDISSRKKLAAALEREA